MSDQEQQTRPDFPAGANDLIQRALRVHAENTGHVAQVVGVAPGRVNLIGEHTDYSGGFVLPMAIDRWTVVTLSRSASWNVQVIASELGERTSIDVSGPLNAQEIRRTQPQWMGYVAGVIEHVRRYVERHSIQVKPASFDLAITSNVPVGAGLSSSAALETAVGAALSHAFDLRIPPLELAHIGRRAEHEFAGVPCGVMDQYISALGRFDHALLIDCRADTARPVPLPPATGPDAVAIVLVNSNVRHALPDGGYAAKVRACENAARVLGVPQLRDATLTMLEQATARLSPDEQAVALHVITENQRVLDTVHAVEQAHAGRTPWTEAMGVIGRLLRESHASLRDVFKVSCPELDTLVRLSTRIPGVHGVRMTGAGFGGSTVALVQASQVGPYTDQIRSGYRAETGLECSVETVRASDGARAFTR